MTLTAKNNKLLTLKLPMIARLCAIYDIISAVNERVMKRL